MTLAETGAPSDTAAPRHYGTIVVVGGGCYGRYYVRQLGRAREKEALNFTRLIVVDHDEECAVARERGAGIAGVEVAVSDWSEFFAAWLAGDVRDDDAIVPSPLMPHLLCQWLEQRARDRWPSRRVTIEMPGALEGTPWQKAGGESTRYVSFATWMCPVNCIEPHVCPHTRDVRHWSLPPAVTAHVERARSRGEKLDGPAIFHCTHRAYGVGMIDVRDVLRSERMLVAAAERGEARLLVGTVSHCHGALGLLVVHGQ